MKKKEIATALGLSVALTMTGCASNEINQFKSETTVELGSDCNIEASEYFELGSKVDSSAIVFDTSAVDTNNVGDYVITVSFKKNTYSINVSVVDTTAPILSVKENIEPVERGNSITASDYAEVDDKSDVNIFWVAEDGETDTIDITEDLDSSVTEINYTLVAVDESGNRSEEKQVTVQLVPVLGTDDDSVFETVDTEAQKEIKVKKETSDDGFVRGTKPSDDEMLKELQKYLEEGLITQEEYDEAIRDYGNSSIYDVIPSNPEPQQANDCGNENICICAADCDNCNAVCSGNYCNIQ